MKTPMTKAEIDDLNARYEATIAADDTNSTHIVTHQVAINSNLQVVREDDESGILYRSQTGRYVYGWESGGFDDQVD